MKNKWIRSIASMLTLGMLFLGGFGGMNVQAEKIKPQYDPKEPPLPVSTMADPVEPPLPK